MEQRTPYRLFSWEHSYFSGKVRAYLRYKERMGGLAPGFEDILATNELVMGLLFPATGTIAVPQLQRPDGTWVQDSSEIIDAIEQAHPSPAVVPVPRSAPRQCLVSYLLELFADEWMLVQAFWQRWRHTLPDVQPNHARYNALQWGSGDSAASNARQRLEAGETFFEVAFRVSQARTNPGPTYAGSVALGVTDETEAAWDASMWRILTLLEAHFAEHDFCLGGQPTLGDFALLAPLYAHLYRDPVPGVVLREAFPFVADWVDRTNGTNALNARTYDQKVYGLGTGGELIGRPATSDGGRRLDDDAVPTTLHPVLGVFFEEMWPVLRASMETLTDFIASASHTAGEELPGKSFSPSPGFEAFQQGEGALTHEFVLGDVRGRRMVLPYQIWMLQRIEKAVDEAVSTTPGRNTVEEFLGAWPGGLELLDLSEYLRGCRVRKDGGLLHSVVD